MQDSIGLVLGFVVTGAAIFFAIWTILRLRTVRRLPGDFDFDSYKRQEPK